MILLPILVLGSSSILTNNSSLRISLNSISARRARALPPMNSTILSSRRLVRPSAVSLLVFGIGRTRRALRPLQQQLQLRWVEQAEDQVQEAGRAAWDPARSSRRVL